MAIEATPARASAIASVRDSEAFRAAVRIGLSSRMAVLLVAVFAALSFGPASGGLARENAAQVRRAGAHARDRGPGARAARPVGLGLVPHDRGLRLRRQHRRERPSSRSTRCWCGAWAPLFGGSHAALLIAAFLVSLAAFVAALALLYRLTELELGRRLARPTLLLLAVFPAAVYFGAPYSESLFLLLAVGAFYAARTGHWAWAGACAGLASATRSAGLLLVLPLVVIWWGARPRRAADAAWLLLAPLGIVAYAAWLGIVEGDAFRFLDVQEAWSRHLVVPLAGAWDGLVAAFDGVRQLASGSRTPVYFDRAAGDPFRIAAINVMLFATLVFAVVACVGVFRRLPRRVRGLGGRLAPACRSPSRSRRSR